MKSFIWLVLDYNNCQFEWSDKFVSNQGNLYTMGKDVYYSTLSVTMILYPPSPKCCVCRNVVEKSFFTFVCLNLE